MENQEVGAHVKAALVVAHPGHELRIHHWLELNRPLCFCVTDGSGRSEAPRMHSTTALIKKVGSAQGSIFGHIPDQELYRILLEGQHEVFVKLLQELTTALIEHGISEVAGDAPEGATPAHDMCRYLIDAAVFAAERATGRRIANREFVLDSPPHDCPAHLRAEALWLRLDEAALERKLQAALAYTELRGETEEGLRVYGKNAFALECLRPSTGAASLEQFQNEAPAYERYGREGVERFGKHFGKYEKVITFREHVWPAAQAMTEAAKSYAPAH